MKKSTLALAAVLAGAAAAYFLDPRQGEGRRRAFTQRTRDWLEALGKGASRQAGAAGAWAQGLQQRWKERGAEVHDDEALAPLSMTPPPLEAEPARRSRMLPALAVAGPVAVAVGVGAALLRQRDEEGQWLH